MFARHFLIGVMALVVVGATTSAEAPTSTIQAWVVLKFQDKKDLNGTWTLAWTSVPQVRDSPGGGTTAATDVCGARCTIAQDESTLTVTRHSLTDGNGNSIPDEVSTFLLGGTPRKTVSSSTGGEITTLARWVSPTIVITATQTAKLSSGSTQTSYAEYDLTRTDLGMTVEARQHEALDAPGKPQRIVSSTYRKVDYLKVEPIRLLLVDRRFSTDIPTLEVAEVDDATGAPEAMSVRLVGHPLRPGDPSLLANMSIQVWLLRADGTALVGRDKDTLDDPTAFKPSVDNMEFWFQPVPAKELAGVVVSVNGKLLVREIRANPAS